MVNPVPLLRQEGFKVPKQSRVGHHPAGMRIGYRSWRSWASSRPAVRPGRADDQDPAAGRGPWTSGSRARRLCPAPGCVTCHAAAICVPCGCGPACAGRTSQGRARRRRRASNTGVIMVAGQKIALGRTRKHQTVTVLVSETTLAVELDNGDVRVIRRTTTQPVRSIKGQRPRTATSISSTMCRTSAGGHASRISRRITSATITDEIRQFRGIHLTGLS
jgi:hypothetical protein